MYIGIFITLLWLFIALFTPIYPGIGLLLNPTDSLSYTPGDSPSFRHCLGTNVRVYSISRNILGIYAALQVVF